MGHQFAPTSEWLWNSDSIIHYETNNNKKKECLKSLVLPCIQLNLHHVKYSTVHCHWASSTRWINLVLTYLHFRSPLHGGVHRFLQEAQTSRMKGFCDICYWWIRRYSYKIVRAGLAWSNFSKLPQQQMHVVAPLQLASHRTFRSKNWQRHILTNSTAKLWVLLSSVVTQHITKVFVPNEGKPSSITTFNLLAFNITWKWRQYNAQKCHAYFEGYGNENGRSWAHDILENTLIYSWKIIFYKNKNKKLRSGAILRSGGDAKQVYFLSGLMNNGQKQSMNNDSSLSNCSALTLKWIINRNISMEMITRVRKPYL